MTIVTTREFRANQTKFLGMARHGEHEGRIALLTIYDKQDAATVNTKVIRQMAREMGFEV